MEDDERLAEAGAGLDHLWLEARPAARDPWQTQATNSMPFEASDKRAGRAPRSLAVKSKQTNRLFRLDRLGSELVENVSEFFQTRNVIRQNDLSYSRIRDQRDASKPPARLRGQRKTAPPARRRPDWAATSRVCSPFELAQAASKVAKLPAHSASGAKKPTVSRLLGDLVSGRGDAKRSLLLLRLLQTPIFLAALFSSMLLVSLLVVYTISYHHHNRLFEMKTKLLFQAIVQAPGPAGQPAGARNRSHHINSRQLNQTDERAGAASLVAEHIATDSSLPSPEWLVVETECAHFEGVAQGDSVEFRGIAYASPPTGARRWSRPRPIWLDAELCPRLEQKRPGLESASPTIVKANQFRSHCVQLSPISRRLSGSEDCLYLDIFRASANRSHRLLPVLVYIHGGFLAHGSSGQADQVDWLPARPTGRLAAELDVVLVAPNYRLQALGFMALSQLAQNNLLDGSEGNYGLWDQLLALKWIKRNIKSFGGDPDNIVLFGPDSASSLPLALLSQRRSPRQTHAHRPGEQIGEPRGEPMRRDDNTFLPTGPGPLDGRQLSGATLHDSASSASVQLENRPQTNKSSRGDELFRAAWLINPTVYYEQPYELANQHYQRLIESQSVCSSTMELVSASRSAPVDVASAPHSPPPLDQATSRLLGCLMNLTAEQVVREYLGKDDPAFRLDDQSSLPIRNIFADQFVTIDEELVQSSYPFADDHQAETRPDSRAPQAPPAQQPKRLLIGSSAQAVEYWPCPRNLYNWRWDDFRRYVGTSLNSFSQETYTRASEMYSVPPSAEGPLVPPSGELASDPVKTYLTMVSDIRQVCPINELTAELARPRNGANRVQRYIVEWRPSEQLSASLRQPANNCGLESDNGDEQRAARTSNETSQPAGRVAAAAAGPRPRYAFHYWDLLAFFGFDSLNNSSPTTNRGARREATAAGLMPDGQDLRFQAEIRRMVKEFAWNSGAIDERNSNEQKEVPRRDNGPTASGAARETSRPDMDTPGEIQAARRRRSVKLFALDKTVQLLDTQMEYKQDECKMWRKFLKHSYAWLS